MKLKEIKQKYRTPRDKQIELGWWQREILGNISLVFTKLFLYLKITPNQVSISWVIIGIIASLLLAFGNYWLSLTGALLLQFYFILDLIDGVIARIRKIKSHFASFLHLIGHNIIDSLTFMGLTIGVYIRYYQSIWVIVLGFLSSISILLLALVFLRKMRVYYRRGLNKKKICFKENDIKKQSFLGKAYGKINIFFKGGAVTNFIMVCAVFDMLYIPLIFYGVLFPLFIITILIYQYFHGFSEYDIYLMQRRFQ